MYTLSRRKLLVAGCATGVLAGAKPSFAGTSPIMLASALNGNVIDIQGNSTAPGALLDAFPSKAPPPSLNPGGASIVPAANQAWEMQSDPASGHFFIVNPGTKHCIDIVQNSTSAGAALDASPIKQSNYQNQLWDFLPDQYSGYFFIQNPQTGYVIEIEHGSTNPGAALVVNRRRLFDNKFQLWQNTGYGTPPQLLQLAQPAGALQGNSQYVLMPANQSQFLIGTTVIIDIIEDLVASSFSVQINGNAPYPPPNGVIWDAQWSQFALIMQNNSLVLWQQVWHQLGEGPGGKNDPLETQPTSSAPILRLSNNTVPAGTRIVLTLDTDNNNYVTGITGQPFNSSGTALGPPVSWSAVGQPNFKGGVAPESSMSPLAALQVVVVGSPHDSNDHFTAGMGTITIRSNHGLSTQQASPNPHGIFTAENSNCYYGQIQNGYHDQIVQPFGLPNPRMTSVEGVWTFSGAGLLPNSKLTVTGSWTQGVPGGQSGNVLPNTLATSQSDGSFSVLVEVDNPNAPYASGTLGVKVTDSGGNWAAGEIQTPQGTVPHFSETSGGLGPPY